MSSISENVDDRLGVLPEDIISHILSLMPTKFAVRTSILSKRWRYSWMFVTNLDFDVTHHNHNVYGMSTFVDRVLESCKPTQLQSFRLHFNNNVIPKSRVSSWIDKGVRLNVCELDIQLNLLELPLSMLTCKTLTKLKLDLSACEHNVWECPSSVNIPCLKTLDIVVYTNPRRNALKLVRGCPMLESLSLKVIWSDNTTDYIFNIPTLKRLKLTLLDCGYAVNTVVLHVPNLEYLFVGGMLGSVFAMKDLSPRAEAYVSFDCEASFEVTTRDLWGEFLKGISGVRSLSVEEFLPTSSLPVFVNMKHLELKTLWHFEKILESTPQLDHLCIEKLGGSCWIEPRLVPACMLTNLTTIKFSTRKWQKCDMEFLEYMLGNAEVLKTVTITWENSINVEEETRLCAELLELPRASRHCEIHFTVTNTNRVAKDCLMQHR